MADYFIHDLVSHLIVFQATILLIVVSNMWITRRVRHHPPPDVFPMVSILIPARNEERNIADCMDSLLAQDYPNFEVLVLDDQSGDGTRDILRRSQGPNPDCNIGGLTLPWVKWARIGRAPSSPSLAGRTVVFHRCRYASPPGYAAGGSHRLVRRESRPADRFPRQVVRSWGERLLVPFSRGSCPVLSHWCWVIVFASLPYPVQSAR